MNVQTSTIFGSLLIEFKDDGSGLLHVIRTDKTFVRDADTGANLIAPKLEAVAITQEEMATLLGEQFAGVAAEVTALTADLTERTAQRDAKTTELTQKMEALTAAQAQITALQEQLTGQAASSVPTVSDLQARLALAQAGKLIAIDAYVSSLPADNPARIFYERALTWRRDNATLIALAQHFGMTDADIDQLFALAETLS